MKEYETWDEENIKYVNVICRRFSMLHNVWDPILRVHFVVVVVVVSSPPPLRKSIPRFLKENNLRKINIYYR